MKTYFELTLKICKIQEEDIVRTSPSEKIFGVADFDDKFNDDDWS